MTIGVQYLPPPAGHVCLSVSLSVCCQDISIKDSLWLIVDVNRHDIHVLESFCYAIGAYASLRHACFRVRSIEGQTKVDDSTGNLIALH